MTVLNELRFDGLSDGNLTVSSPWSLPAGGVVPTVAAAAATHGAKGCRWASTTAFGRVDYDFATAFTAARVLSFYFNIRTFSTVNQYVGAAENNHTSGTWRGDWRINTAKTVTLRNGATAVATSTATLAVNTVYRAEWKMNPANATQELRIYAGESATPLIDLNGAWSATDVQVFSFGPYVAASGGAIDYDTIKVADDWVGADAPPVVLTPVLRRYRYNGTFWE